MVETKRRSFAKAISWRIIASLTTALIVWLWLGDAAAAVSIGALDGLIKIAAYFAHERAWNRIKLGRANG